MGIDCPFAEFLPEDKHRAGAMAALCAKRAQRIGGVEGLEAAVDYLYGHLSQCPRGMVEYAAKLFLTHDKLARDLLKMRSLEERQPGMVEPSKEPKRVIVKRARKVESRKAS